MSEKDRQLYIEWLLIKHPFKAEEYFTKMDDRQLIEEYEKLNEYL